MSKKINNPYYAFWKKTRGFRDRVFEEALMNTPQSGPLRVVEVGGPRDLSQHSRYSDGWSTLYFADALKDNDNFLLTLDLDPVVRDVHARMTSEIDIRSECLCLSNKQSVLNYLVVTRPAHLYYLDGSNDPTETKDQFEWIRTVAPKATILIDDMSVKGAKLIPILSKESSYITFSIPYRYDGIKGVHFMGLYVPRPKNAKKDWKPARL